MKKIITPIIIVLCLILGFVISKPIRANFTRNTDILNFFTKHSMKNISKETRDQFNIFKKEIETQKEKQDISPIIVDYITKMLRAVGSYYKETPITVNTDEIEIKDIRYIYLPNDLSVYASTYYTPFTAADIEMYKNMTFETNLVNKLLELSPALQHNSENMSKGWEIDLTKFDNELFLDLPYGHRLTFRNRKYEWSDYNFVNAAANKENNTFTLYYTDPSGEVIEWSGLDLKFEHKDWFHKEDMTINAQLLLKNPGEPISTVSIEYLRYNDFINSQGNENMFYNPEEQFLDD